MQRTKLTRLLVGVGLVAVSLIAILWSSNVLTELFGGPQLQFKHVLAAITLLWAGTWCLRQSRFASARHRIHQDDGRAGTGADHE